IGLGIEDLLEPVDDDLVPVRVSKLSVIGKPEIGVMNEAVHIDCDQWRAQGNGGGGQETYDGPSLYRVENPDAGVCLDADDALERRQAQDSGIRRVVHLRRILLDNSVISELG